MPCALPAKPALIECSRAVLLSTEGLDNSDEWSAEQWRAFYDAILIANRQNATALDFCGVNTKVAKAYIAKVPDRCE